MNINFARHFESIYCVTQLTCRKRLVFKQREIASSKCRLFYKALSKKSVKCFSFKFKKVTWKKGIDVVGRIRTYAGRPQWISSPSP